MIRGSPDRARVQIVGSEVDDNQLFSLAEKLGELLLMSDQRCATAESCTGGLIAKLITDIAGSSAWFEFGFVTYANRAKEELLGVPACVLEQFGAVSEQVVRSMAAGALDRSGADMAVSVSGVAGPGGGSVTKPVGLVWMGAALRPGNADVSAVLARRFDFTGHRDQVRRQAAREALGWMLELATQHR